MEVSILLDYVRTRRGTASRRSVYEAARLCADAGFHFVEYTPSLTDADWRAVAREDAAALSKAGVEVEQVCAPVDRYDTELLHRTFEAAAILGARYVIIRADIIQKPEDRYENEMRTRAVQCFTPEIEFARAHGLKAAFENLYEKDLDATLLSEAHDETRNGDIRRYTVCTEELLRLIESFGDDTVGCCWNFGYAQLVYERIKSAKELAKLAGHVLCTHVSDNYPKWNKPLRIAPFMGDNHWEEQMAVLRETGFQGKLTLDPIFGAMPDELIPLELEWQRATVGYLAKLFEAR